MIEINLLPGGVRKKASAGSASVDFAAMGAGLSARFGDKFMIGCIALMIATAGAGAFLYYKQDHDRVVADERLDKALKDSTRFAGVVAARIKLEAKRDTLLRQVNLIRVIDDDRFIWPHIMDEVSRALPPYTWVTILSYGGVPAGGTNLAAVPPVKPNPADTVPGKVKKAPKMPTEIKRDEVSIRLAGLTVDVQALTRFMNDLEASPFLSGVVMERTTPGVEQGKEVYLFQLLLNYSRPDSTVVRRVPLFSGGR